MALLTDTRVSTVPCNAPIKTAWVCARSSPVNTVCLATQLNSLWPRSLISLSILRNLLLQPLCAHKSHRSWWKDVKHGGYMVFAQKHALHTHFCLLWWWSAAGAIILKYNNLANDAWTSGCSVHWHPPLLLLWVHSTTQCWLLHWKGYKCTSWKHSIYILLHF